MNNKKITIITVCRNASKVIEKTILSVINQTYPNLEYIIIDGASTDRTPDIIRKYESKISYWISEPDKGIYDAMNKGLEHANGEWVNFMNAGDSFIDSKVVEDVFENKEYPNEIQAIGGWATNKFKDHTDIVYTHVDDILHRLPFCHQSTFMRVGNWRYDLSYKIAADYKWFYDINEKYGKKAFAVVARVIADYRMDESFSLSDARRVKKEYLRIQSVHKDIRWYKDTIKIMLHLI